MFVSLWRPALLVVVCAGVLYAQPTQPPLEQPKADVARQQTTATGDGSTVTVEIVEHLGSIKTTSWTAPGQTVTVVVKGLKTWAKQHNPQSLRLYLAGQQIPHQEPTLPNVDQEYVNFPLKADTGDQSDRKAWIAIVSEARNAREHKIPLTVGSIDTHEVFPSTQYLVLDLYPPYTKLVTAFIVALLVAIVYMGFRTDLLRDTTGGLPPFPARPPYSLGRVQMAFWFYLVISSYLFIWKVSGEANSLTASVLTLIGISASTGLAAIFVDQQKLSSALTQRAELLGRQTALQSRIQQLQAIPAPTPDQTAELVNRQTELGQVNLQVAALPPAPAPPHSKGLIDLVRDANGVSFHRFQILVWTLVLGAVFVRSVNRDLAMPEFDNSLLILMGISSGTYVGFKFPETPK